MSVRSMMKQKGRKEVDIKALKEAKRAKLAHLAKENELKERKRQKEKEREILDEIARSKPQPTNSMAPPPAKRVLPAGFFDAVKPPSPVKTNNNSSNNNNSNNNNDNLPSGFFDSPQTETTEPEDPVVLGGLVGYGSDSDSEDEEEGLGTTNQTIPNEDKNKKVSTSELPEGFFDDEDLDLKARGREPEVVATEQREAEVEEFMSFAEKVGEASAEMDEVSTSVAEESVRNSSLEQALYMNRVAKLMRNADKEDLPQKNEIRQETESNKNEDVETIELNVNESDGLKVKNEVEVLVVSRKKKRKAAAKAVAESDFIPLDPTNWRSKMI